MWFLLHYLTLFKSVFGDTSRTDPYSLINKVQTDCEYAAITVGSKLADAYNSFTEDTSSSVRFNHKYLASHLGFAGAAHNPLSSLSTNSENEALAKVTF